MPAAQAAHNIPTYINKQTDHASEHVNAYYASSSYMPNPDVHNLQVNRSNAACRIPLQHTSAAATAAAAQQPCLHGSEQLLTSAGTPRRQKDSMLAMLHACPMCTHTLIESCACCTAATAKLRFTQLPPSTVLRTQIMPSEYCQDTRMTTSNLQMQAAHNTYMQAGYH
jgi:hypothetical protein